MKPERKIFPILRSFSLALGLSWLLLAAPVRAEAQRTVTETAAVDHVIDGDTLVLADKRHVRIDGINALEIPHKAGDEVRCLPSTRRAVPADAAHDFSCDLTLAKAAKTLLHDLTADKPVTLTLNPERPTDRYGRVLAQVSVKDAAGKTISVAEALLTAGLAHVYPLSGQEIGTAQLLPFEEQARVQQRGIWRLPELQVTPADKAATQYGHYTLIEGRVLVAAKRKGKIYLNFGADYHTDFSVIIDKRDWKNFAYDPLTLEGKHILVRGYLYEDYGPALRVTNDGQVSVVP